MVEAKRAPETDVRERVLPLVLEIVPGQAGEGLIDIYEPGSYEREPLRSVCQKTLSKKNWSVEDQQIVDDITRQLDGGRLLCRGKPIEGTPLEHGVVEETEAGEKYLYVPIRAIKPQEGGFWWLRLICEVLPPASDGGQYEQGRHEEMGPPVPEMPTRVATAPRTRRWRI